MYKIIQKYSSTRYQRFQGQKFSHAEKELQKNSPITL